MALLIFKRVVVKSLDSDPQMEADETRHKAAAVLKAIKQINTQAK